MANARRAGPRAAARGIPESELLSAAAELFARRGYRATTLDDLAGALRIKKASLYHYIRSKEDLLTAIYDRIFDRIEAAVRPLAGLDLPVDERLRRMLHAHVEIVAAEIDMLAVAFREEAELSGAKQRAIRRRKRDYEDIFERVIAEGVRDGVLRPIPSRLMARALLGMCNWMYQWYRPERHAWEQIAGGFSLLLEAGWLADDDPRRAAWVRPENVDEVLAPSREAVRDAREQLDRLSLELARAAERLHDGLARR